MANPVTIGVEWSNHALIRWAERFPELDREEVFGLSVAAPKKIRAQIGRQCNRHRSSLAVWFLNKRGALYNREHKIAFIMGFMGKRRTVVTVFPLTR